MRMVELVRATHLSMALELIDQCPHNRIVCVGDIEAHAPVRAFDVALIPWVEGTFSLEELDMLMLPDDLVEVYIGLLLLPVLPLQPE